MPGTDRRKRLDWFSFTLGERERWRVAIVAPHLCRYRYTTYFGLCKYARREILINVAQPIDEIGSTLIHEQMHCGRDYHPRVYADESFISQTEARLFEIVSAQGYALPPFPAGFYEMRARHVKDLL